MSDIGKLSVAISGALESRGYRLSVGDIEAVLEVVKPFLDDGSKGSKVKISKPAPAPTPSPALAVETSPSIAK